MADEAPALDPQGISRTLDGTIANQPAESSPTTTPSKPNEPGSAPSLLNQTADPAPSEAADGDDKPKPEGAPEKYEDYKVPEGFTLDPKIKSEVDGLFKGMGLTQDQAQSLVDFYTKQTTDSANAPYEAYRAMTDEWKTQAESHPDLRGKLGPGQEVNVRIGRMLSSLPDQQLASDFRALMDLTGAGNNQAFIRVIDHLARQATEGTHVSGGGPSQAGQSRPGAAAQPSAARAMWPNLPSST